MLNLNPIGSYADFLGLPLTWGGFSSIDLVPSVLPISTFFGPPLVGRGFYGSGIFSPFLFSGTPLSHWGPDWYQYDKLDAGTRLLGWGDAMIHTDPWLAPFYMDQLEWQHQWLNWMANPLTPDK